MPWATWLLAISFCSAVPLGQARAWAGPPSAAPGQDEAPAVEAKRLTEEAARAYRLRDFATTIERLDRAYSLTGEMALLYDLGDAHGRYYELDHNPDHLRQARAFFRTFARRSEAAQLDPRDAWERVATLNRRIETAPAIVPSPTPKRSPLPPPSVPEPASDAAARAELSAASDVDLDVDSSKSAAAERERSRRRSDVSVALFGAGGALMIPGIVLGAVYYAEGKTLTGQLAELTKLAEFDDCGIGCDRVAQRLGRGHERALVARRAATTGTALAVIGGLMVAAGLSIQIYNRSEGRSDRDRRRASVDVAPSVGGLSLLGRF